MKKLLCILLLIVIAIAVAFVVLRGYSRPPRQNILVAYFSATGNTATVANRLANAIGTDIFAIEPETMYSDKDLDWRDEKSRSSVEMADRDSRPVIVSHVKNMSQYDVVFVGFPIWWGREPSIIDTFMESYDFVGKIVVPFATSGSTPTTAEAAESIQSLAPSSNVQRGVRFPTDVSTEELKSWASGWL